MSEAPGAPLFLVGAQRSGTTALGLALAAAFAERGWVFTVEGKLPYLLRRWCTPADRAAMHMRCDEVIHGLRRLPVKGVDADAWIARASGALHAAAARMAVSPEPIDITATTRAVCAEAYGGDPWGDKYNEYLLDLEWLDAIFPRARWIYLVRDPRAVISSMLAWGANRSWNPRTADACARKWAHWNDRWLAFRGGVAAERRLEVDYATLCAGGHEPVSEFTGLAMAGFLAGYERRRDGAVDVRLPAAALRTVGELQDLGLLRGR
jgi:hypothetical protein